MKDAKMLLIIKNVSLELYLRIQDTISEYNAWKKEIKDAKKGN